MQYWLQTSLERVFPNSPVGTKNKLELLAARGERVSFQACVHNPTTSVVETQISVTAPGDVDTLVRRVGYVPMNHHTCDTDDCELDGVGHIPGFVPDPLFPEERAWAGPGENQAFWITVAIGRDVEPGIKTLDVHFKTAGQTTAKLSVQLNVSSLVIQSRRNFPVTHWFYPDCIWEWYRFEPWGERFWQMLSAYMKDLVGHGTNCSYVPIFTMPIQGMEKPAQLLRVSVTDKDRYQFDFTDVKRWTDLAGRCGMEYFEWAHLFSQWGVKHPVRVFGDRRDHHSELWRMHTGATSDTYRNFLAQFLPEFHKFLTEENLLDKSFFHLSDEPQPNDTEHLENYRRARALLKELAPWMKIMDALSEVHYAQEGLCEFPVPGIGKAHNFTEAGIPHWVYYCCEHRGPLVNRLLDTPLPKIRMNGWLFYRLQAQGFLQWGYNYWYKFLTQDLLDPFSDQACGNWPDIPAGDGFVVYPGETGPIDSIRWEVFSESLQDYALLQSADIMPDDALLSEITDYDKFPKTEKWINETRGKILHDKK